VRYSINIFQPDREKLFTRPNFTGSQPMMAITNGNRAGPIRGTFFGCCASADEQSAKSIAKGLGS
jgi:hypothetical protein